MFVSRLLTFWHERWAAASPYWTNDKSCNLPGPLIAQGVTGGAPSPRVLQNLAGGPMLAFAFVFDVAWHSHWRTAGLIAHGSLVAYGRVSNQ